MSMTMQHKATIRSRGLNMRDPKVRAELYMQTHGVKELFESMGTLLLFHGPDHPRVFLAQHLARFQRIKQSQGHVPFFEERDLEAMFAAFDVTEKGYITPEQYNQGKSHPLANLGIQTPTLRLPESVSVINHSLFIRSMTQELKNASASFM